MRGERKCVFECSTGSTSNIEIKFEHKKGKFQAAMRFCLLIIIHMSNKHSNKDVFDDFMKNNLQPKGHVNVFGMMNPLPIRPGLKITSIVM